MNSIHNPLGIDTGDTVFHRPSRERWLVAFVDDDRLAWCGWPEGYARTADCLLVHKATREQRHDLLRSMASLVWNDPRGRYARSMLGNADD